MGVAFYFRDYYSFSGVRTSNKFFNEYKYLEPKVTRKIGLAVLGINQSLKVK